MNWNPPVDSKGRTKKLGNHVTAMLGFSLVSNEEPQMEICSVRGRNPLTRKSRRTCVRIEFITPARKHREEREKSAEI